MSGVKGYIITDSEHRVVTDDFGATTLQTDWLAAVAQAKAQGGGQLVPVLTAKPDGTPRRGRRPKQQQEES